MKSTYQKINLFFLIPLILGLNSLNAQDIDSLESHQFESMPGERVEFYWHGVKVNGVKKDGNIFFNGDMVIPESFIEAPSLVNGKVNGAGLNNPTQFWTNNIVYYTINSSLPNPQRVYDAINAWQAKSCIQFVQRSNQANYVEIIWDANNTASNVGMIGGHQTMWLADWATAGNVMHEFGHVMGLYHEQTRRDRDNYIIVHWDKIAADWQAQYTIYDEGADYGSFDFESVMLYPSGDAITKLDGSGWPYNRTYLSAGDQSAIRTMYCSSTSNLAGTYYLQNRYSGLYMDVSGASTADGSNILQWNFNGGANQQFLFTSLGSEVYEITAKHSGKSIDVNGANTADGAKVDQWTYTGGANEKFVVKSTGDGYYKLIASHSGKLIEVGGFSTVAGGLVQQWSDVGQQSGQWKLITINSFNTVIQAENYSAMNGIQTEGTTDAGGGSDVGWIDTYDWMAYNTISIPASGNYLVEYRVASVAGGKLSLDLNAGSIQLGALNVPATGGWQNWTTISHTVYINAGTYNFGIFAQTGGWNINWFRISSAASDAPVGISESNASFSFDVYPNPASTNLNIRNSEELFGTEIKIINAMGIEVHRFKMGDVGIEIASLPEGIYTLMINYNGKLIAKKFNKQ